MKRFASRLALVLCLLAAPHAGLATKLFDTAAGAAQPSGLLVNDHFWPMHRFEIAAPAFVESVGGHFENTTRDAIRIFGAVVALSGSTDLPDALDLSTPDVLGTTLIDVEPADGVHSGRVSLALAPGWYALAFGTGRFGADSVVGFDVILPSLAIDLDPQLPFTAIQAGNPYGTPPQFLAQRASPRFFATPEPGMLAMLGIGLGILFAITRTRKAMPSGA